MENWEKVFCGIIPFDLYTCELINGEMNGLVISLESKRYAVTINFGIVLGLRMFDEAADFVEICRNISCKIYACNSTRI